MGAAIKALRNKEVEVEIVMVSPALAREWLDLNLENNRPPGVAHVQLLADEMINERWQLNGDTVRFNIDGKLIDAQHRLLALIRANVTLPFIVVRNLDADSFLTVDGQRKSRNAGDALSTEGKNNPHILATVCRFDYLYNKIGRPTGQQVPTTLIVQTILPGMPDLPDFVEFYESEWRKDLKRVMAPSEGAWLMYRYQSVGLNQMLEFFEVLAGRRVDVPTSPAMVLRNRLLDAKTSRPKKLNQEERLAYTIKGLNAHFDNREIRKLAWRKAGITAEKFPKLRVAP